MNAEQIRNMEAGRELDAMVAEKVMGWRCVEHDDWPASLKIHNWHLRVEWYSPDMTEGPGREGAGLDPIRVPHYSTDITAAWEVVEKVATPDGIYMSLNNSPTQDGIWRCEIVPPMLRFSDGDYVWADSAPLAICRAALLAVMGDES